jgi:ComF family protein
MEIFYDAINIFYMLKLITKVIKEALFPTYCQVCGAFFHSRDVKTGFLSMQPLDSGFIEYPDLSKIYNTLLTPLLCNSCLIDYIPIESPICSKCGFMFKSREGDDHVCGTCLESEKKFRIARACGVYDRSLMTMIYRFKYNGKIQLAGPLGRFLFAVFVRHFCMDISGDNRVDFVIPVPLHISRFRKRGFNQAFLLVREWEKLVCNSNIEPWGMTVKKDMLTRTKKTESQTGLNRKDRLANIRNAFVLNGSAKIEGKKILIVDDVYTTGATIDECTKVLLKGGAESVDILTLARAVLTH